MAEGAYLYDLPGLTPYGEALRLQQELAAARSQQAIPDTVVLLEHEPVITLGSRAVRAEELPLTDAEYAARGIEIVAVPRGGRSTYHGPGQLVCYPILDLTAARPRPAPARARPGADDHRDAGRVRRSRAGRSTSRIRAACGSTTARSPRSACAARAG